jgi:maltose alpha-D-glucosyltransferase / alpha-amylase
VFYEVLVRGFHDSNGDGTGDIRGLTSRLGYLQWLGIDCLWLLPIYESPLRDGGYDIADFMKILPEFGNIGDFVELVEESHKRGIRVIADLVMNHTSDAHPWFQASRADPDGSFGDFYVWSDTDDRYSEARVIFVDAERSNWSFDEVRGQYYWHRFFSHQPDLNYENPKVQDAMLEVLRFWLDLGIDGFRLDAVPYLYEREGTNCENLKETHEYLKRVRAEVDRLYPDRVLLAEANQWPADVVEYFGDPDGGGDECHMAFHFPLMPRIFMAVRREQRYPISEILAQTPAIPSGCQWGIFLRNHDELTLEMVADDERDYMYAEYARDPRMKANIGIRRRLAPLLDNDREQLQLFTALLLSLPGSPVLYYGDEIGMGDNIWLGDRDGVRTPMQWTPDRNAGFSVCDPARLYLPLIMDPIYGYQALNVEAQERTDQAHDRDQEAAPGVRARQLRGAELLQPQHPGVRARVPAAGRGGRGGRERRDPVRQQPLPVPAAGRAGPAPVQGHLAGRVHGRRGVPGHRRAHLPADPARARLLLVPAAARHPAPRATGTAVRHRTIFMIDHANP